MSPLARSVRVKDGKSTLELPLRQALDVAARRFQLKSFVRDLKLSLIDRLTVLAELQYEDPSGGLGYMSWVKETELTGQPAVTAWAKRWVTKMTSDQRARGKALRHVVFAALLAGKVKIAPAWDPYIPVPFNDGSFAVYARVLAALPEPRRTAAAVKSLDWHQSPGKVIVGLRILAKFPSREVTEIVLAHADQVDHIPKRQTLGKLAALAKRRPEVQAALAGTATPGPALEISRSLKPRKLAELTPLQRTQLEIAGKEYDRKRLSAALRLGVEPYRGRGAEDFQSFAGYLEVREVSYANKRPAYTVYLYLVDSGTIFEAGTKKVVAVIIQSSLLGPGGAPMKDRELHAALQDVIQT